MDISNNERNKAESTVMSGRKCPEFYIPSFSLRCLAQISCIEYWLSPRVSLRLSNV